MLRIGGCLLVAICLAGLAQSAEAQAIIRPPEFSLIRPTFPPNKPYSMPAINVQPLNKQQYFVSTNNNPQPIVFQALRKTMPVPQGIQRQNMSFAVKYYQPAFWSANTMSRGSSGESSAAKTESTSGSSLSRPTLGW